MTNEFGFDDPVELFDPGWVRQLARMHPGFDSMRGALATALNDARLDGPSVTMDSAKDDDDALEDLGDLGDDLQGPVYAHFKITMPVTWHGKTVACDLWRSKYVIGANWVRTRHVVPAPVMPGFERVLGRIDPSFRLRGDFHELDIGLRRALHPECVDLADKAKSEIERRLDGPECAEAFDNIVEAAVRPLFNKAMRRFRNLPHELLHRLIDEAEVKEILES